MPASRVVRARLPGKAPFDRLEEGDPFCCALETPDGRQQHRRHHGHPADPQHDRQHVDCKRDRHVRHLVPDQSAWPTAAAGFTRARAVTIVPRISPLPGRAHRQARAGARPAAGRVDERSRRLFQQDRQTGILVRSALGWPKRGSEGARGCQARITNLQQSLRWYGRFPDSLFRRRDRAGMRA